ncbi:MAG: ABC transporter ATP-binding protein [Candidatus Brocadiae bacterium]|nr:ABC transporter ATP-binding protein [Candidatus Brocadiia bacterium]
MSADPVVLFDRVGRVYEKGGLKVTALREASFAVHPGEYVSIMGPSGSGKSTMLHLLGLLDRPTSGSYRLNGTEVRELDDDARSSLRNRSIGFIFQSFNLFSQLDVVGNVEVPMSYAGVPRRERTRRAEALIEQVGLGHRRGHRPNELSGGEMQRVAIARALANDPALILADEPTGNLDSATAEAISAMLDDLHAKGRTIIMVTHNPELGARTGRTVRVRDGAILDGAA